MKITSYRDNNIQTVNQSLSNTQDMVNNMYKHTHTYYSCTYTSTYIHTVMHTHIHTHMLLYCSIAVKRLHDYSDAYKIKPLNWGFTYNFRGLVRYNHRRMHYGRKAWGWELTSWSVGRREKERGGGLRSAFETSKPIPVTHLPQQCHTSANKITPSILS